MATASERGSAAARWERLVTGRQEELRRLSPNAGSCSGSFWSGGRAERYAKYVQLADDGRDPLMRRLRKLTGASTSVLDVGAGTGRYAIAIAPQAGHLTAVDPSESMLAVLERRAQELGTTNITTVHATWEDAQVPQADVVFSSFVMTLVADGAGFVRKLDANARERVLLYLGAYSGDAFVDPIWRHFHDEQRAPGPSYLDAIAVLRELGIEPHVRVAEVPNRRRFPTVDEAVESYRDWLLLPDTDEVRAELHGLLSVWLQGRTGALRSPLRSNAAAILEWQPISR
jgi:SAM-dependent methyltransferase